VGGEGQEEALPNGADYDVVVLLFGIVSLFFVNNVYIWIDGFTAQ